MITNTGKNILGKYLIGQAPAYASYIAVGCGAQPKPSDHVFSQEEIAAYQSRSGLEFEMDRWQITSRGFITENKTVTVNGVSTVVPVTKVVFTTEVPSEPRYEITEVGVFSAGSNPSAGAWDSKILHSFTSSEGWEYHEATLPKSPIPLIDTPLDKNSDGDLKDNSIIGSYDVSSVLSENPKECPVFSAYADDRVFNDEDRLARFERPRFLNDSLFLVGDMSTLTKNSQGRIDITTNGSTHIHNVDPSYDLSKNSPIDELKLAFSVVNKNATNNEYPDQVLLVLEFTPAENESSTWQRFEVVLDHGTGPGQHDFTANRYFSITKKLQEIFSQGNASWETVGIVKIYACVKKNGVPSDNFYVCLDALRLENVSSYNPLYGMTGYSVISNSTGVPITKEKGTTSYLEFRFALEVS